MFKTLKNKYDAMKRDWHIWRFLKFGKIGDQAIRKLNCFDEQWDKSIMVSFIYIDTVKLQNERGET